jgi:hypothetical protein
MNKILMMPRAGEMFAHPFKWAGKHLAFYTAAALTAGVLFVSGAALYAYVVPLPTAKPEPGLTTPSSAPEPSKLVVPEKESYDSVVALATPGIPAGQVIGAQVVDSNNVHIGNVKDVTISPNGQASATIKMPNGATVSLPTVEFTWDESLNHTNAVASSQTTLKLKRFKF